MCQFPSWIETDDKHVLFLTDNDLSNPALADLVPHDCCGHTAIRRVYPGAAGRDCEQFPCPPAIVAALRAGKLAKIMAVGGVTECRVTDDGLPLVLSAGGNLYLRGLKTLPANAKLSAGSYLDLGGLTKLPANAKLTAGGCLYLGGLTKLPTGAKLSAGGYLDLGGLTKLPTGAKLSAGGYLYLKDWHGRVEDAPRESVTEGATP
ncbi:MAG TPA: hypothetical protein VMW52_11985 [Phycisphaerae bacterium]|nr:hypothetical protein [Phycisphaerae bacterium]